jgi:hypothetical protein
MELSQRLDSLNEIRWVLSLMGSIAGGFYAFGSWFEVGRMVVSQVISYVGIGDFKK